MNEALRLAPPADVRTCAYARFMAGTACRALGLFPASFEHLAAGERAFEGVAIDHPEAPVLFPILVNLRAWRAEAHAVLGCHTDAVKAAEDAVTLAREIANVSALTFANAFLGYARLLHGDVAHALPLLEQALAGARGRYAHASRFAASFLAYALALDGQDERAVEVVEEYVRLTDPVAHYFHATCFRTTTISTYLLAGRPDEALRELDFVVPFARRARALGHLPTLLRLRAETLLQYSAVDLDEVRGCCLEARDLAAAMGLRPELAHSLSVLARAHLRAGDIQSGREHFASARALFKDLGMDYSRRVLDAEADGG